MPRILLIGREPDSLSDIERAALAKIVLKPEFVRIDPADWQEHLRICHEQGNPPVVVPQEDSAMFLCKEAVKSGVPHFFFGKHDGRLFKLGVSGVYDALFADPAIFADQA